MDYLRKKAQRDAWVDLSDLKRVAGTTLKQAEQVARMEDAMRAAERTIEVWSAEAARARRKPKRAL